MKTSAARTTSALSATSATNATSATAKRTAKPSAVKPGKASAKPTKLTSPASGSALGERFAGGEAALAREAEVLARLEASLTEWWSWAKVQTSALASDDSALLRQRMADVLIEQLVATAVLAEARDHREEGGEERDREGALEAVALLRHRVRRCLQLAIEAIADSRGEAEAAGELAWMRSELSARRAQLAPRGEGVPS